MRLQWLVVVVGVLLLAVKFLAWYITGSNAILTDALESIINVLAGSFALYSLFYASRPRDLNHPYGHGKIEFISASIEGSLIVLAGLAIIGKAIYNFIYPQELEQLNLGMLLTLIGGVVNFGVGWAAERQGRKSGSVTMEAGGKHLKSDAYSTAGLLVGLGLIILTGAVWLDNAVAIVFGGIICFTGVRIVRQSIAGILDEADYKLLERVVRILDENRRPNWIDIHNLRIIKYGRTLHIDCHLTVPWYLNVLEAHEEVEAVEQLIRSETDQKVELFVHTDPCVPASCEICTKADCDVRQEEFRTRRKWTLEDVIRNQKHQYRRQQEVESGDQE